MAIVNNQTVSFAHANKAATPDANQTVEEVQFLDDDGKPIDIVGGGTASVKSTDITDATEVGRGVLTAKDAATARTAIGAGTSSLALGTTKDTALAGDTPIPKAYTLPAATAAALGGVKQGVAVAGAAGDTPTKTEFAALLKSLSDAGIIAAS